ncbi:MAG: glycosyltransferase family 9 protein, partial [Candidatus Cloacimonetes bacterium]|nr:glycosyltransferase family 9 protein [Candidatus Cloacimonadota bacterium]
KEALELKDTLELTPYFHLAPENIAWAQQWLIDKNLTKQLIGIHPGCMAKNKYRRWNKDYFVELITLLIHAINCDVVVIAGPDELDVGSYISEKTNTRLLTGAALSNVAAVIAKCSFFINTDSSLGHVASCFGVNSLTIFGPGDENQTAPFSENSHVIRHSIACAPCIGKKRKVCEVECLTRLKPITVFNEAMRLFPK